MHIRLYDLSKGLENNTYVDPRLTNSFRELRDELKDLYHYSKLDRIFEEKAETQAKIMEKLRKGAADAKIALYQLEGLRAALKRTGAKAEDLREETEIAVRAGAEAKKESIVNMLKKLMPVILIVGFAFFFVGGILSTEPTGNFVGTPALNIFTAIFSLILLLTGAVFFRKSSLR